MKGREWIIPLIALGFGALPAGCSPSGHTPTVAATYAMRGQVRDRSGSPVADGTVSLEGPLPLRAGEIRIKSTDSQGRFAFDALVAGRYQVSASIVGQAGVDTVKVPGPDADDHLLTLSLAGAFRGTATLAGRTRYEGILVFCDPLFSLASTDSLGHYVLGGIPPGNWFVSYTALGYDVGLQAGTLAAEGDTVDLPPIELTQGHGGP